MGLPRVVTILTHPCDDFWNSAYTLADLATLLREHGVTVHVVSDPDLAPEADLGFLHVDMTRVDQRFARCMQRFAKTVNFQTLDISKRAVCSHIVRRGDGYDGPVIVKTDRNCAGIREAALARRSLMRRVARSIHRRLPWQVRAELGGKSYPVFDSVKDVPWIVWRNPWLVVERFKPERAEGTYVLRSWVFCGSASLVGVRRATTPVVRPPFVGGPDLRRIADPGQVPKGLWRRREELGFQFGKFDFTLDESGEPTIFDVNRTPTGPSLGPEQRRWQSEQLLMGLESLMTS